MMEFRKRNIQKTTRNGEQTQSVSALSVAGGGRIDLSSKLDKSIFDDMFSLVEVGTPEAPKKAIQAKYDLYSIAGLSARGISNGGGGSVGALANLVDVIITNPEAGQSLVFDGSHWTNGKVSSGGGESVGTLTINLNGKSHSSVGGVVTLPDYPKTLPANGGEAYSANVLIDELWSSSAVEFVDYEEQGLDNLDNATHVMCVDANSSYGVYGTHVMFPLAKSNFWTTASLKNVSQLTNDKGYLTQHQSLAGYATETWVKNQKYLTSHQSLVHCFRRLPFKNMDFNIMNDDNDFNGSILIHADFNQTNAPFDYGQLLNFKNDASNLQIAVNTGGRLYTRNLWWSGGGGKWSGWSKIAYSNDLKSYLPLSGGTMTGNLTFSSANIELGTNWIDGFNGHGIAMMDSEFNTHIGSVAEKSRVTIRSKRLAAQEFTANWVFCNNRSTGIDEFSMKRAPLYVNDKQLAVGYNYILGWGDTCPTGYDTAYGIGSYRTQTGWGNMILEVCNYEGGKARKLQVELKSDAEVLWCSGNILAQKGLAARSDIRYKKDVTALIDRGELKPIEYNWREDGVHDIGFSAQEVQRYWPELVVTDDKGVLHIKYSQLTAVLAAKINAMRKQIEDLERRIA